MFQKTLHTERTILRCYRGEDLEDFFRNSSDGRVGPNAGWPPHTSIDESRKILGQFIAGEEVWAIELKETGRVVGSVGLHADPLREVPDARMIGYALSSEHWGRGLMPEVVRRMQGHAFGDLGVRLLSVYHFSFNDRSRRVIEKCGFRREGTLRHAKVRYDGLLLDEVLYSMTLEEFQAPRR